MYKGGQPNNTNAQKRGAFLRELNKELTQNPEQLRKAIKKLLEQASKGEPWAIQMLADRLDGKPISGKLIADSGDVDDEATQHVNRAMEELFETMQKKMGAD
jgi:hypothetical protein